MSAFESDFAEDLKNPKFAYEFGRHERELEIIKLLEEHRISIKDISEENWIGLWRDAIQKIKGEKSE